MQGPVENDAVQFPFVQHLEFCGVFGHPLRADVDLPAQLVLFFAEIEGDDIGKSLVLQEADVDVEQVRIITENIGEAGPADAIQVLLDQGVEECGQLPAGFEPRLYLLFVKLSGQCVFGFAAKFATKFLGTAMPGSYFCGVKVLQDKVLRLSQLPTGHRAVIKSHDDSDFRLTLMEMGCIPGEPVWVEMIAPMGDPMAIQIAGYYLSIRKQDAERIWVELL